MRLFFENLVKEKSPKGKYSRRDRRSKGEATEAQKKMPVPPGFQRIRPDPVCRRRPARPHTGIRAFIEDEEAVFPSGLWGSESLRAGVRTGGKPPQALGGALSPAPRRRQRVSTAGAPRVLPAGRASWLRSHPGPNTPPAQPERKPGPWKARAFSPSETVIFSSSCCPCGKDFGELPENSGSSVLESRTSDAPAVLTAVFRVSLKLDIK